MDLAVEIIHATVQLEQALGDGTRTVGTGFLISAPGEDGPPRTVLITANHVFQKMPGVSREAITVEVVDGDLNLSAVRKTPATEGKAEETSATLSRSIQLPVDVQTDAVSAVYENGVLTVTLPKREEAKPRKVNVAVK